MEHVLIPVFNKDKLIELVARPAVEARSAC
jgi:hypothetical protein